MQHAHGETMSSHRRVAWAGALIAALLLTGCGAAKKREASFQTEMNGYVGNSADALIRSRGVPTSTATLSDGGRVLEYSKSRTVVSGGGSFTVNKSVYVPSSTGGVGTWVSVPQQQAVPVSSRDESCKLIFEISADNLVMGWKSEGRDCF